MIQFEDLMGQIDADKNELFEKIQGLEEENELLVNEKHNMKIEVAQVNHQKIDLESQLKACREQMKVLDSLNNYKEEALQEQKDSDKEMTKLINHVNSLKTAMKEMQEQDQVKQNKYQKSELAIIQLKSELQKEKDFVQDLKKEIAELRQKYMDSLEHKKTDLGMSNLMASKMFNIYKMRESTRLSYNMPISFQGEPLKQDPSAILAGKGAQNIKDADGVTNQRPSLRDSTMMSRLSSNISKRQPFWIVHEYFESFLVFKEKRLSCYIRQKQCNQ